LCRRLRDRDGNTAIRKESEFKKPGFDFTPENQIFCDKMEINETVFISLQLQPATDSNLRGITYLDSAIHQGHGLSN